MGRAERYSACDMYAGVYMGYTLSMDTGMAQQAGSDPVPIDERPAFDDVAAMRAARYHHNTSLMQRLVRAGEEYASQQESVEGAREAARVVVQVAAEAGISEQAIADLVGVSRLTIRKWLGK